MFYCNKKYHANKELEFVRKNNLGSFFNFVRNKLNNHTIIKDILKSDGTFASSEHNIAETLSSFFVSMFTVDDGSTPLVGKNVNLLDVKLESVTFTPMTVNEALRILKPSTSAGPDGLPNVLLRNCADSLALPPCHILDTSFKDSKLPPSWKIANVLPNHKKDARLTQTIKVHSDCVRRRTTSF
jgi:hypothetical protein